MQNISGIYKIQSKIKPERIYIGSAINISNRWSCHLKDLKFNKHGNSRLQNHYNKYGKDDLVFSIIVGCAKENLVSYEQFYIDALNPYFNICKIAGSSLGKIVSLETKRLLSESHKGYVWSEESKLRLSQTIKGRKLTEEQKINMKGRVCSKENRKKISEANKGKTRIPWNKGIPCSEETKRKLSESKKGQVSPNKGKIASEETRQKISEAKKGNKNMLGHKHTEESKIKISDSNLGKIPWNKGKKGSQIGWMKGKHHTEATKEKMAIAKYGHIWNRGRHHSEQSINNMKLGHSKKIAS